MGKSKLFKAVPDDERKDVPMLIRMTRREAEDFREAARIRNISGSEYVRRLAAGRQANVDYEKETVLALSTFTQVMRELCVVLVDREIALPEELLRLGIQDARAAMLRIGK